MVELPLEIMYDIFSRMPVKSLACFRCVSKPWCSYINDPYLETMHAAVHDPLLLMLHQLSFGERNSPSPCALSFSECKEEAGRAGSCTLEVRTKPPAMPMGFMCNSWYDISACNGLLYVSQWHPDRTTTSVVIHPLKRECYELPPIRMPSSFFFESGLGFDDSTNTFKMVCVTKREQVMVHILGTDSWRKIPKVPSYPVYGVGVFANGCLHWLADYNKGHELPLIIGFDVKTEEFGLIQPPRKILRHVNHGICDPGLANLHGQLGFVYTMRYSVEVWVLKERGWVMYCEFKLKPPLDGGVVKVLGFWNKSGDILVTHHLKVKRWFVYNLKSDSLYEVSVIGCEKGCAKDFIMYQNNLFSTRYSIKNPRNFGLIEFNGSKGSTGCGSREELVQG
ncbi:putative F-box domain-containing protein [Helianthus annuus]|nr:putative F-box domain-containing protein [Helianthus annuus]